MIDRALLRICAIICGRCAPRATSSHGPHPQFFAQYGFEPTESSAQRWVLLKNWIDLLVCCWIYVSCPLSEQPPFIEAVLTCWPLRAARWYNVYERHAHGQAGLSRPFDRIAPFPAKPRQIATDEPFAVYFSSAIYAPFTIYSLIRIVAIYVHRIDEVA